MTAQNNVLLLIAEDDPDDQLLIREAIKGICTTEMVTCFMADGVELMRYLQKSQSECTQPALIVLDLNMPRKDGRSALREIKADPAIASIPIVILTTSGSDEDMQYCLSYGIQGYYRKPGSFIELENIFRNLCTQYLHSNGQEE